MADFVFDETFAQRFKQLCEERGVFHFNRDISRVLPLLHKVERFAKVEHRKIEFNDTSYTLEEMKSMAMIFYKDIYPKFYERIKSVLSDPTIYLQENEPNKMGGDCSVGIHNGVVEVRLNPKSDIRGIKSVAHEFAHILSARNQKKTKQRTDAIGEIEGIFIERLYEDYLLENGIINKKTYEDIKFFDRDKFLGDLHNLFDENEIIDRMGYDVSLEKLQRLQEDTKDHGNYKALMHYIDAFVNGHNAYASRTYRYVVGYIVAEVMYNDYKKEPQKVLERFDEFLENEDQLSFQDAMACLLGRDYVKKIEDMWQKNPKEKDN